MKLQLTLNIMATMLISNNKSNKRNILLDSDFCQLVALKNQCAILLQQCGLILWFNAGTRFPTVNDWFSSFLLNI